MLTHDHMSAFEPQTPTGPQGTRVGVRWIEKLDRIGACGPRAFTRTLTHLRVEVLGLQAGRHFEVKEHFGET